MSSFTFTTPVTTSAFTPAPFGNPFGTLYPTATTTAPGFPIFTPATTTTPTPVFSGFTPVRPTMTTPAFPVFTPLTTTTTTPPFPGFTPVRPTMTTPAFPGFIPATTTTTTPFHGFTPARPVTTTPAFPGFTTATTTTTTTPFPGFTPVRLVTTTPAFPVFTPVTATTTTPPFPGFTPARPVTTTPAFPGFSPTPAFPVFTPATTTATAPVFPAFTPATTIALVTNPQLSVAVSVAQTQPTVSTTSSQPFKQEKTIEPSAAIIQQGFLAATLLDPYANRGTKDFTTINQKQVIEQSTVVSVASVLLPTTTAVQITSAPIPISLPLQSNSRKLSPARPVVNINLKLKPSASSLTLTDDVKSVNQQPTTSTIPLKSTLAGGFTDEEESVLLSRNKMSKLRISSDLTDASSQSNSLRSLYPARRLADFENVTHMTPPSSLSSSPKNAVEHQRSSRSSSANRDISSEPHLPVIVEPRPSSSPNTQPETTIRNTENYRLPMLTRENYYTKPTISELKTLFNDRGECLLKEFTVGHEKYGSVTFYGQMNVAGLNLDQIIGINRHEVIVYPDDDNKPPVGEELNRAARITLLGVYPTDRTTREEITDVQRIKEANYTDYLREMTKKFDGEFINYEMTEGAWTFMVQHFTRYGLDDNRNVCTVKS